MSNNNASSNLIIAQRAVKQLRFEASIRRIKVSQAAEELMNFCLKYGPKDPLLIGVPSSDNPFRPPKSCSLFWAEGTWRISQSFTSLLIYVLVDFPTAPHGEGEHIWCWRFFFFLGTGLKSTYLFAKTNGIVSPICYIKARPNSAGSQRASRRCSWH